jgi:hypothetical protein
VRALIFRFLINCGNGFGVNLQVPNSTKMLILKACHNILPTKDNLLRKCMDLDPACVFYKTVSEKGASCFMGMSLRS